MKITFWLGILLLAICAISITASWIVCEDCELKIAPSLICGIAVFIAIALIIFGLSSEEQVETQKQDDEQEN